MSISFNTILFAMLIFANECNSAPHVRSSSSGDCRSSNRFFEYLSKLTKGKSTGNLNIDDMKYDGDPITVACVSENNQHEFHMVVLNGSVPKTLLERLDNGNGLSIFFHGAANEITHKSGLMFWFAREWFTESGNNICIISYAYTTEPSIGCSQAVSNLNRMVTTNRIDYVAKMARDLVVGIQEICWEQEEGRCLNIHEVDLIGFSFGAHVAASTCEYLKKKTDGEKVRMLLALDPSRTPPVVIASPKSVKKFKKGLAHYVQVIHTSVIGISQQIGDVDIYVKSKSSMEHGLDFFMFVATATKRLYMLAEENGNGTMIRKGQTFPEPKRNECVVGVYGTPNPNHFGKKFTISLMGRNNIFNDALGMYHDEGIFFE